MVKTPEQKWREGISAFRNDCKKIMGVSKSIRYAGVINQYGRTLTGVIRPGVKPLLKSDQIKNEFFIISTLITLRKGTSNAVGKLEYVVIRHQKVSIIAIQKGKVTYYISVIPKEKGLTKIISGIKKIL